MTPIAPPRLYLRRQDGSPSEPLNAATFHQIGRTIHDIIMGLQQLHIANSDKSERWERSIIHVEVQDATHQLSRLCWLLERIQDDPTPLNCKSCVGVGWRETSLHGRQTCDRCGGTGLRTDDSIEQETNQ